MDHSGAVIADDVRFAGVSAADQAALEWALRTGDDVVALTVGPPAADDVLRDALACGASRAVRVDAPFGLDSAFVASALASACEPHERVWCGDYSIDRGTGSVPAFLAAALERPQALGLVDVTLDNAPSGPIEVVRRLDGGRRERLLVRGPAVLSVEGSTARLRRAPLSAALEARSAVPEVITGPPAPAPVRRATRPYRPRARVIAPPQGATALERVRSVTQAETAPSGEFVTLEPALAASRILDMLTEWGYLGQD
jgi:electron transfer flavoprotein beta subunit